jgi:hypothetical protein
LIGLKPFDLMDEFRFNQKIAEQVAGINISPNTMRLLGLPDAVRTA